MSDLGPVGREINPTPVSKLCETNNSKTVRSVDVLWILLDKEAHSIVRTVAEVVPVGCSRAVSFV